MHHVKSLDASTEHLHHRYGAWSRQCGSTELIRGAHLLVSTPQIELPREVKGLDGTINEHCVIGMHHVKSLDASTEHLHHRYGAWSRQCRSAELVRGALLLVSTSQIELPH